MFQNAALWLLKKTSNTCIVLLLDSPSVLILCRKRMFVVHGRRCDTSDILQPKQRATKDSRPTNEVSAQSSLISLVGAIGRRMFLLAEVEINRPLLETTWNISTQSRVISFLGCNPFLKRSYLCCSIAIVFVVARSATADADHSFDKRLLWSLPPRYLPCSNRWSILVWNKVMAFISIHCSLHWR